MKNSLSAISGTLVLESVTGVFSVVGFFVLRALYFVQTHVSGVLWVSLALLVIGAAMLGMSKVKNEGEDESKRKSIIIGIGKCLFAAALPFLTLSLVFGYLNEKDSDRYTASAALANETISLVNSYSLKSKSHMYDWMPDAIISDQVIYLLVPSTVSPEVFTNSVADKDKKAKWWREHKNAIWALFAISEVGDGILYQGKYNVAVVYKPIIKKNNSLKRCIVLDESVAHVMKGSVYSSRGRWEECYRHFEIADSLGNAAATFYLARLYTNGYGIDPKPKKGDSLLLEAARKGARPACVEMGERILNNPASSKSERYEAERYLKNAITLHETVGFADMSIHVRAVQILDDYYRRTERYKDAYRLTKNAMREIAELNVKYKLHLDNCLLNGKYAEAAKLVEEGENVGYPYAYIIHAKMLTDGIGMEQNFEEAERLYLSVSDSVSVAYRGMADLYRKMGRPEEEVAFWRSLYKSNYSRRVD